MAAYERGDFSAALDCFAQAENETRDPGLVAFNKAAALYQLGQYDLAAEHYRRCLEDAAGVRRVRALYGRGNALAQEGNTLPGAQAVAVLELGLESYTACLEEGAALTPAERAACEENFTQARANLEIVKRLLQLKEAEKTQQPSGPDSRGNPQENLRRPGDFPDFRGSPNDAGPAEPNPGSNPATGGEQPRLAKHSQPGKGTLPPLPDDLDAPPLDPAEALRYLQAQIERIRQDRANQMPPDRGNMKALRDW
jgi:tetratricopeptide (TPR) repeat protein